MAPSFVPAQTGFSRVHIIQDEAGPVNVPTFLSCGRADTVDQALGDITKIECPDPFNYDRYIEQASIKGEEERGTADLIERYASDEESFLYKLRRIGCPFDTHINFGQCTDPGNNNAFTKKIILANSRGTNISTDSLGALESSERAAVNATFSTSWRKLTEVLRLGFAERGLDTITTELLDVIVCDTIACGSDCDDESEGCEKIFAVSTAAGGSPGTPPDVVFSLDGGVTILAVDIDTMTTGQVPTGIACVGDHIVVTSNETNSVHIALKSEFTTTPNPTWTEVSTGFVVGGEPNDIWSIGTEAFICGDGGFIYRMTDPTAGVTVLDAGVAIQDDLQAIHALDDNTIAAVGTGGGIVATSNGQSFQEITSPVGVGVILTTVWIKEAKEWWIGGDDGNLRFTEDEGVVWTTKAFNGSGAGTVEGVAFSGSSIGYLSHTNATPAGRLLRTYDGGQSWIVLPETSGNLPANDQINAIAACVDNVNFLVGVGLGDNATDGFWVTGTL